MPNVFACDGFVPALHESAFLHPNATVMGNVVIGRDVYVGPAVPVATERGAIVAGDGCNVREGCTGSIVGALCFVPAEMQTPPRSVVVGNPARVVEQVSNEMLAWKTEGAVRDRALPARLHASTEPCGPLRAGPAGCATPETSYRPCRGTRP
jgi:carbonic anhydrase/acetyltransferase-like protein (isoleucine patch superfamily)